MSHTQRIPCLDLIIGSGTACSLLLMGCGNGNGSPLVTAPSSEVNLSQPAVSLSSALQVNTLLDETNDDGTCSLREAIQTVNGGAAVGGCAALSNKISFDPTLSGILVLNSALPLLEVSVNIQGPGAETLTVSGENSFRIFEIEPEATVVLADLTLANGSAGSGGGIFNRRGQLSLNRVILTENSADEDGGALFNRLGEVVITASEISGNDSGNDDGGGIDNNGGILQIRDSLFTGNSAGDQGGAIRNRNGGDLTLSNSTLSGNSAGDDGGAIGASGGTTTRIVDTDLINNSSEDTGGAIFVGSGGTVLISRSTVTGNTSNDDGGGLRSRGGFARVIGSMFSSNVTFDNGGGISSSGSSGVLQVSTSHFDGNSAADDGGGIWSTATQRLIRNTFTSNTDSDSINSHVTGPAVGTGNIPMDCNDGNC